MLLHIQNVWSAHTVQLCDVVAAAARFTRHDSSGRASLSGSEDESFPAAGMGRPDVEHVAVLKIHRTKYWMLQGLEGGCCACELDEPPLAAEAGNHVWSTEEH